MRLLFKGVRVSADSYLLVQFQSAPQLIQMQSVESVQVTDVLTGNDTHVNEDAQSVLAQDISQVILITKNLEQWTMLHLQSFECFSSHWTSVVIPYLAN